MTSPRPPAAGAPPLDGTLDTSLAERTAGVPEVPDRLLPVALALCEPMLRGGSVPATYRQVAGRLGIASYKRVRLSLARTVGLLLGPGEVPDAVAAALRRAGGPDPARRGTAAGLAAVLVAAADDEDRVAGRPRR